MMRELPERISSTMPVVQQQEHPAAARAGIAAILAFEAETSLWSSVTPVAEDPFGEAQTSFESPQCCGRASASFFERCDARRRFCFTSL
jgi:hypothetical protein